jgi:hypothetical protein
MRAECPWSIDSIFFLEIEDTNFNKLEMYFLIINDTRSPRFDTDRDEQGRRTKFTTVRRRLLEEIRAMEAGLAPGYLRQSLRLFGDFIPQVREFLACIGQDMVIAEPLAYNNVFVFEKYGFGYFRGIRKMSETKRKLSVRWRALREAGWEHFLPQTRDGENGEGQELGFT